MNIHSSARTSPAGRGLLVQRVTELGWTVREAADAAGASPRTAYNWLMRGEEGIHAVLVDGHVVPCPGRMLLRRAAACPGVSRTK